jgi:hypothetical protein
VQTGEPPSCVPPSAADDELHAIGIAASRNKDENRRIE